MNRVFIFLLALIFCCEEMPAHPDSVMVEMPGTGEKMEISAGFILYEDTTLPKLFEDMKIWFPTSFTPNGDGLNDEFKGEAQNVLSVEISIQNLRGDEVFHAYDIHTAWDGEFLGNQAGAGPYVWKARATGYLNNKKVVHNFHGVVELIR